MAKVVVHLTGDLATAACGADQLCCGLKAGIEGGVHAATHFWNGIADEPDCGFLQLDAQNAFNELDRSVMLWIARHEWPTAFHFVFNCYQHHALLVVHSSSGKRFFLYSKVGVTQGDPLSMVLYGLSTLPLIRELKVVYSELFHVWFADDGNAGGHFWILKQFLQWLHRKGHSLGYKLDLGKCVLITPPANLTRAMPHCF
jgi:hypothetical protein